MKTFFIVVAVLAVVVLIVVFRQQIGAFFNPAPKDGDECKDSSGNSGTIVNGACVTNPPEEGSACILNGRTGIIQNGACVVVENAQRIIIPTRITVRRTTRNCLSYTQVPQYPGIIWNLIGSNRFFCYYSR